MVVPEWEVEITPGGPTTVLNGTIEEVHDELLQLNPDWDEEYAGNSTDSELTERDSGFELFARTDFSDAEYHCGGRWPKCRTTFVNQGISYLRRTKGKPTNGPGPGNCGRVSCSFNSAIWWCNDVSFYCCGIPIEAPLVINNLIPERQVKDFEQLFKHCRWCCFYCEEVLRSRQRTTGARKDEHAVWSSIP